MKHSALRHTVVGGFVALALMIGLSGAANAQCKSFPEVAWWKASPTKVTKYVGRKHGGDWSAYILKWERYQQRMEDISARGSAAVVKSHGVKLKDQALVDYIGKIKDRIAVTRCLANTSVQTAAAQR